MYNYRSKQVELLSPVGNWDSLYAAVQNGCDAVYLGGKSFNARENADNFSLEELKEVFDYAHIRGVKVYLTVNTLYKDSEVADVLEFIEKIYHYGVDAVILQDLGVARLVSLNFPDLELHASTQLTIHNLEGARYLEELGFSRVVVARELSIPEIKEIAEGSNLEVESFVHGALCISYSGQCLMSSLIGGRSGNRGRCAQPCRLPYTLVDLENEGVVSEEFTKKHLLSPKDINTLEIIPELIDAGISSFKIEGRMKRAEYTALITEKYRKYLDQSLAVQETKYQVKEEDQEEVKQIFNRGGFIPGYYLGKNNLDLISYQRPKNWGIKVAQVIDYDYQTKECKVKLSKEVKAGDGIEIWTKSGRNPGLILSKYDQITDDIIRFKISGRISSGDLVYRTSHQELLARLQESFQLKDTIKNLEIYGRFSAKLGESMKLKLWDQAGHYVESSSDFLPEEAKKRAIGAEDFQEQLEKLGNTPYQLGSLELDIDNNLFVPISKINELRRDAVEKLNQIRSKQFISTPRKNKLKIDRFKLKRGRRSTKKELSIYLKGSKEIEEILKQDIDRLYYDIRDVDLSNLDSLVKIVKEYKTELFIRLPQIARLEEIKELKKKLELLEKSKIDGYLVPQLGIAEMLKNTSKDLIADYPLNNFNSYTVKHWSDMKYKNVILSPELNLKEIKNIANYNNINKEVIIYGHLPMMITEYCAIASVHKGFDSDKDCNHECLTANYGLLDRKGMVAPIEADANTCRTIIYNSQPLYLVDHFDEIMNSGCQSYRLDFVLEDQEEIIEVIKAYKAKLNDPQVNSQFIKELSLKFKRKGYTTGHFYRGVE
ncbi:DUF3656 domain-containing U32 family peptidase [Orenia marismortui]|uniref:DUF3656 domain-containing U32 family peptidase n=1 Tax=Orenia marismortui TaxID=46469 RepID=UPI00037C30B6|nr:U32 family peptidase [Orenia marismortui]